MDVRQVLVANRGEVALRIIRAARELGLGCVSVFSEDDGEAAHAHYADRAHGLRGQGPSAYLDQAQLIEAALALSCQAVHPGYGFLSENAAFARRCSEAGLRFIGPGADTLALLGDKVRARDFAQQAGVPVLSGSAEACTLAEATAFFAGLGPEAAVVLKAVAGGGGRGMRVVRRAADLPRAFEQCAREAGAAFGNGALFVEQYVERARHVEVQILGDGSGAVVHAHERECSVQRRHQKLIEISPCPGLDPALRAALCQAAVTLGERSRYLGLGTIEFLVDPGARRFWFIEANPRLQVEHTVTEEVLGLDLVQLQLALCSGASLAELGFSRQDDVPQPRGFALQLRINAEQLAADGSLRPQQGTVTRFEPPLGPGLRLDTHAFAGYAVNPRFDSLLAKLVVHHPQTDFGRAVTRAAHALKELQIEGVETNRALLLAIVEDEDFRRGAFHTGYLDAHGQRLVQKALAWSSEVGSGPTERARAAPATPPLERLPQLAVPAGLEAVRAPMLGTVVSISVALGERVVPGATLAVLTAMKMEHEVVAARGGVVREVLVAPDDGVVAEQALIYFEPLDAADALEKAADTLDLEHLRPDLAEVLERHAIGLDHRRPKAVEKRRRTGHRTARENVSDLCDEGTFVEYGALQIAAQRRRRSLEDLIENTPADGLVAGVGCVNAELFGRERARCVLMSYDYTVLAGTQGAQNHHKKDRMFELAERQRLPVVFFTEGGGGRPGDTDVLSVSWLDCLAFLYFGQLSGLVPLVGIATGRCFAGNAALFGCCDVTIATEGANIGMGGPAMIEGGGLGVFPPEAIGPVEVQTRNGVVDIRVKDEAEAVAVAKQYLSYFQGRTSQFHCADQRKLRFLVPENRLRVYDVRKVIETLADTDSVLELRRGFGAGMVTALARIEGRPLGIIANNPAHLAGAIDRDGADKAARFMQLCDAFDLPLLFLCDTPGIMVGPQSEEEALVRHAARMFVTAGSLTVPFCTLVLRKGYGLGAMLMAGGSFHAPLYIAGWPTSEFGGMGLEGSVKLGFRRELDAIEDPEQRKAAFDKMVEVAYALGKGVNIASQFEIDDVIDPADSRRVVVAALESAKPPEVRSGKKRPCVDTW